MSRWPNKYVIGLTGNIAVGKSVVRQMLQHLGAYTIDADGLSHQAMQPGAPAYNPVVETFGKFILGPDQRINRALLGQIVFSNPVALAKLESIVHPIVRQAINTLVARAKQPVVVIEAIKLLEGDLAQSVDSVWVVNASPETQLQRLQSKRNMSPDAAKQRITAQNAQQDKLKQANVIIQNDGNVELTWQQVQTAWAQIKGGQDPAPAQAATLAAQPQQPTAPATAAPLAISPTGEINVEIKRGMPANAEIISRFISSITGRETTRMDIMLAFGQKSYLFAEDGAGNQIGVMGWQVENLITTADEIYLRPDAPPLPIVRALLTAIEEASSDLQSEVSFIFLPPDTSDTVIQTFTAQGYDMTTMREIKIPAWREAVQEVVNAATDVDYRILTKKLREDRVLQPL